jgi:hypothetical protein
MRIMYSKPSSFFGFMPPSRKRIPTFGGGGCLESSELPCRWVNWGEPSTVDSTQWTRSWRFWCCCREDPADCQCSEARVSRWWIPHLIISFEVDHFMDRNLKCMHDRGCHSTTQGGV